MDRTDQDQQNVDSFSCHFMFVFGLRKFKILFHFLFCQREDYMQKATTQTAFVTHQNENTKGSINNKRGKKRS